MNWPEAAVSIVLVICVFGFVAWCIYLLHLETRDGDK